MRNEIKELRKKQILEAAKTIVLEQGLKDISARNIGELCGMSYATLYNYYKDLNELLANVAVDLLQDSYQYVISGLDEFDSPKNQIINVADRYYEYMVSNPNRFKVIFVRDYGTVTNEIAEHLVPKVGLLLNELLNKIDDHQLKLNRQTTLELLASSIHAKLLFQVYNRTHLSYQNDLSQMRNEIEELIK